MNDRLKEIKAIKKSAQGKVKDKGFSKLSNKEKDEILETLAKMFGLIK